MQKPKFVSRIQANALAFASVSASSLALVCVERWDKIRALGLAPSSYLPFIFLMIGIFVFQRYRSWIGLFVGSIVIWELHLSAYLLMDIPDLDLSHFLNSFLSGQYYYSLVLFLWLAAMALARLFISPLLESS